MRLNVCNHKMNMVVLRGRLTFQESVPPSPSLLASPVGIEPNGGSSGGSHETSRDSSNSGDSPIGNKKNLN